MPKEVSWTCTRLHAGRCMLLAGGTRGYEARAHPDTTRSVKALLAAVFEPSDRSQLEEAKKH
jgi:hypothetical protein